MKATNVRPITELKNRTKALISEIVESGQSVVITQNGKPRVVVMDAVEHDRMQDTLAMLKLLAQSVASYTRTGKASSGAEVRRRVKLALDKTRRR
jgi:prevent-host-death family protein